MHPLLPETTVGWYRRNKWPTLIIGKKDDKRSILIIGASVLTITPPGHTTLCGLPLPMLLDNWTHGRACTHTPSLPNEMHKLAANWHRKGCTESWQWLRHASIISAWPGYLHRLRCINEDAYFQNHVPLLRRTASHPQHLSISLTAYSAIAGGVFGTDTPRLRQCNVGRSGKQSSRETTVCDEWCCTARLFSTEVRSHHTAAPGPSLTTRATEDRIQARCTCLPLLAWLRHILHENCAVWQTRTRDGDFVPLRRSSWTFHQRVVSPSVAAARVWNSLPSDVTASPSLSVFKRRLKTSLFSCSFDIWLNCVTLLLLIFLLLSALEVSFTVRHSNNIRL